MAFIRPVTTSTRSPNSTASRPSTRCSTILAWILPLVLYLNFAEFVSTCTPIHIHVNCIPRSKLIFANTWNPLPCSLSVNARRGHCDQAREFREREGGGRSRRGSGCVEGHIGRQLLSEPFLSGNDLVPHCIPTLMCPVGIFFLLKPVVH